MARIKAVVDAAVAERVAELLLHSVSTDPHGDGDAFRDLSIAESVARRERRIAVDVLTGDDDE